jgi:hypothetical protein
MDAMGRSPPGVAIGVSGEAQIGHPADGKDHFHCPSTHETSMLLHQP